MYSLIETWFKSLCENTEILFNCTHAAMQKTLCKCISLPYVWISFDYKVFETKLRIEKRILRNCFIVSSFSPASKNTCLQLSFSSQNRFVDSIKPTPLKNCNHINNPKQKEHNVFRIGHKCKRNYVGRSLNTKFNLIAVGQSN